MSKEYYDFVEQHLDGSWWYHGGWKDNNFDTRQEAETNFKERFWWDLERPFRILKHMSKFPDVLLVSKDLKVFRDLSGNDFVKFEVVL